MDSILKKSLPKLQTIMENTINYVDIDYEVVNPKVNAGDGSSPWTTRTRSTIMKNERAVANAYRLWLQGSHFDYVRRPGFSGFFDNQLNDRFQFDPSEEPSVAAALKEETKEKWPDIVLLDVQVKCLTDTRCWWVKVSIADKNTLLAETVESTISA
jgi:hypothetical protein